jgi:hypothetical protein
MNNDQDNCFFIVVHLLSKFQDHQKNKARKKLSGHVKISNRKKKLINSPRVVVLLASCHFKICFFFPLQGQFLFHFNNINNKTSIIIIIIIKTISSLSFFSYFLPTFSLNTNNDHQSQKIKYIYCCTAWVVQIFYVYFFISI